VNLFALLFALLAQLSPAAAVVEAPPVVEAPAVSGFSTGDEAPSITVHRIEAPPVVDGPLGPPAATPDGGLPDPDPSQVIPDGQLIDPRLDCDEDGCASD